MEADAETLFDYLGKRYEDAFAENLNLHRFISEATKKLPAQNKVLDVGCGTGKPVAQILELAGHDVHRIDISQEMVKIASSQVKGKFQKADMRKYQPSSSFDGFFVILSLFQITPGETYSMVFK
jgi:predicted TPR repeat methyltransferase